MKQKHIISNTKPLKKCNKTPFEHKTLRASNRKPGKDNKSEWSAGKMSDKFRKDFQKSQYTGNERER